MNNNSKINDFFHAIYRIIFKTAFLLASVCDTAILYYRKAEVYVITKILNKDDKPAIFTIHKNKMLLSLDDPGISRELMLRRTREPISTKTIKGILKKGDVVLDIGANIGYYALIEARLVGESGKVYACEPVPQSFDTLKKNVELNRFNNIELFNTAIGDINGELNMYLSAKSNIASMLENKSHNTGSIKVRAMTGDDFLKNKKTPNILRMDVEGYEFQIIKGMAQTLKKDTLRDIFIEMHFLILPKEKYAYILNTLKQNGFKIRSSIMDSDYYSLSDRLWLKRVGQKFAGYTIDDFIKETRPMNFIVSMFFSR